jgi:choline dehydrogenase
VIVSAGAFASPKILMLSGIGAGDVLAPLGIDVVAELPGVGENLQEHLWTPLQYEVDIATLNQEATPLRVVKHGAELVVRGSGPATATVGTALVFGRLTPDSPVPEFQAMFGPFAMSPGDPSDASHDIHGARVRSMSAVTSLPCVLHPYGRGSVTLRSANPADPPRISYALAGDDRDVDRLIAICRRMREVYTMSPIREHVVREVLPGPSVETDDEWRAHIHAASFGGAHGSGTCKMGVDDRAVVDPELRVHGIDGLRVVDASIMPTITSGNTNAPVIMIAERASDLIRATSSTA